MNDNIVDCRVKNAVRNINDNKACVLVADLCLHWINRLESVLDWGLLVDIKRDDVTNAKVIALVSEHLQGMALISPPESVHDLGVEALRKPNITFWSAWEGDELLGCGAVKELDNRRGYRRLSLGFSVALRVTLTSDTPSGRPPSSSVHHRPR